MDFDVCEECGLNCDAWDMQFCCILCQSDDSFDYSQCEGCDPWDI